MRKALRALALLTCGLGATHASALDAISRTRLVESARSLVGMPYLLGGRLKKGGEGIDCQGLVFYALQTIATCGWKSWSVYPTQSLATGELGQLVYGPVNTRQLDMSRLQPGDVLWLIGFQPNPAEPAIGKLGPLDVWVWHVGMATDSGRFINADPFEGRVVEVDLKAYLEKHQGFYAGVIVSRMERAPVPAGRCRQHPPMRMLK